MFKNQVHVFIFYESEPMVDSGLLFIINGFDHDRLKAINVVYIYYRTINRFSIYTYYICTTKRNKSDQ
jgi:hypothetical protein